MSINLAAANITLTGVLIGDTNPDGTVPASTIIEFIPGEYTPISAALEIQSIDGAFVLPRMTTAQRDDMGGEFVPGYAGGMLIYNLDTNTTQLYVGTAMAGSWVDLGIAGAGLSSLTAGTGLTATPSNPLTSSGTILIADTGVFAGTYGDLAGLASFQISVNSQGQIVSATNGASLNITNPPGDYSLTFFPTSIMGGTGYIGIANQGGVTPGSYTNSDITVNDKGIITAISNGAGGGAPATSTYILQTPDVALSNAQPLSLLATGLLKSTTATGVVSIAVAGTDYYAPGFPTYLYDNGSSLSFGDSSNALPSYYNLAVGIGANAGNGGNSNTVIGCYSRTAGGGSNDVMVGAGISIAGSGGENAFLGTNCFQRNATGGLNVGIGQNVANTGTNPTNLQQCVLIGANSTTTVDNLTNAIAIGYNSQVSANNSMNLGNSTNVGINQPSPAYALHVSNVSGTCAAQLDINVGTPTTPVGGGIVYTSGTNAVNLNYMDATGAVTTLTPAPTAYVTYSPSNPSPSGLVFSSFSALTAYIATQPEDLEFTIYVDVSYQNPAQIGSGTYALPATTKFQGLIASTVPGADSIYNSVLQLTGAVVFTGIRQLTLENLSIVSQLTSGNVITVSGTQFYLKLISSYISGNDTSGNFLSIVSSAFLNSEFIGSSYLAPAFSGPATAVIVTDATTNLNVYLYDMSDMYAGAITGYSGNLAFYANDECFVDASYGAQGYTYATPVAYTQNVYVPGTPSDWTTNYGSIPAYLNTALDTIAAKSWGGGGSVSITAVTGTGGGIVVTPSPITGTGTVGLVSTLFENANGISYGNTAHIPTAVTTYPNFAMGINVYNTTATGTGGNFIVGYGGGQNITTSGGNLSFGAFNFASLAGGSGSNVAFGLVSQQAIIDGSANVSIGNSTLQSNVHGIGNTAIGDSAGKHRALYTDCTFIGANADASVSALTNASAFGYNASVTTSNSLVLGSGANVGINQSSPAYPLHVSNVSSTCAMQLDINVGTPATPTGGGIVYTSGTNAVNLKYMDATGAVTTLVPASGSGTVTSITQGTGMNFSVTPITTTGTINLANTAVTPGSYTYGGFTVDQQGRLTAASSGTAPVTSVSGTASNITSTGGTTPVINLATVVGIAGTYTNPSSITFDTFGRATSASSGSGGSGTVTSIAPLTGSTGVGIVMAPNPITTTGTVGLAASIRANGSGVSLGDNAFVGSGTNNFALGNSAYSSSATGNDNVAIGADVLWQSTNASNCVAIGLFAINAPQTSTLTDCVAIGSSPLKNLAQGADNIAIGTNSSFTAVNVSDTIAIGQNALQLNTTSSNIGIGANALQNNVGGTNNCAVGINAALSGTSAVNTCAFGGSALESNVIGNQCSAFGFGALVTSTGDNNSGFGKDALGSLSSGTDNTGLGWNAGASPATLTGCIFIGSGADSSSNGLTNSVAIGYNSNVTASNSMNLGADLNVGINKANPAQGLHLGAAGSNFQPRIYFTATTAPSAPSTNDAIAYATSGKLSVMSGQSAHNGTLVTANGSGAAATSGTVTLNGITGVTVSTTAVSASSLIFLTADAGSGTPVLANSGSLVVGNRSNGVSFTIYSTNVADTSNSANWLIVNS